MSSSSCFDVVVIGLGGHGSAALYNLAKSGLRVLGVERFSISHTLGSSHGDTRVTRKLVFEHPTYVDLVTSSYEGFEELAKQTKRQIFQKTGGVFMGKADSELVQSCLHVAKEKNLQIKVLKSHEISQLNSHFDLQGKTDIVGVYDPDAGVLFPENCITSFVELAVEKYGAVVKTGTKYLSHLKKSEEDQQYSIITDTGVFTAKKIVFACGMWNTQIIDAPLEVRKIQVFWFEVPKGIEMGMDSCPIFMYEVDKEPLYYAYGFPNYQGQGMKIGFSPNQYNNIVTSINHPVRAVDTQEKHRLQHVVKEFLPRIGESKIIDQKECYATMTPDEHFIIDFHPEDTNIVLLSPCSAHGFKYTAGVGKLAAQMIISGERDSHYAMFRIDRFKNKRVNKTWNDTFIHVKKNQKNLFEKYYKQQQQSPKL